MRHTNTNAPICPACGARHYPATLGSGARVWCDGSPANPREEIEQRERAALRTEARARTGEPLDVIDVERFRAALDDSEIG